MEVTFRVADIDVNVNIMPQRARYADNALRHIAGTCFVNAVSEAPSQAASSAIALPTAGPAAAPASVSAWTACTCSTPVRRSNLGSIRPMRRSPCRIGQHEVAPAALRLRHVDLQAEEEVEERLGVVAIRDQIVERREQHRAGPKRPDRAGRRARTTPPSRLSPRPAPPRPRAPAPSARAPTRAGGRRTPSRTDRPGRRRARAAGGRGSCAPLAPGSSAARPPAGCARRDPTAAAARRAPRS